MKKLFLTILACCVFGTWSLTFAQSTISSLSEVTGQPTPSDIGLIVDLSDTSMSSSGTNKKVPVYKLSPLSGISPFTDNSYTYGGVTLTPDHFGDSFSFSGATHYQVWFPDIDSGVTGQSIEFIKLGTGQISIYARSGDFINQSDVYEIPSTGVSTVAIARLMVISGNTIAEIASYNTFSGTTQAFLANINQNLGTGVTPTFAGVFSEGLLSSLSGISVQGISSHFDGSGNTIFYVDSSGVTVGSLESRSGITTPTSCLWQATSGESIFIYGTTLYYSDSTGVDHALH